jgi:hypothetical protein
MDQSPAAGLLICALIRYKQDGLPPSSNPNSYVCRTSAHRCLDPYRRCDTPLQLDQPLSNLSLLRSAEYGHPITTWRRADPTH